MDTVEVDLGALSLTNRVLVQQGLGGQELLVESAEVCFSGVGCTLSRAGKRGQNIVQNAESGWRVRWRRPLVMELRGELPMVRTGWGVHAACVRRCSWAHSPTAVPCARLRPHAV